MTEPAETLIDLLDGDLVRIETPEVSVTAEVIDHEREPHGEPSDAGEWRYSLRFMPVGEDATAVNADRYRVDVTPDGGGWSIGELIAEVYVEEDLTYESEPRGDLTRVEALGRP